MKILMLLFFSFCGWAYADTIYTYMAHKDGTVDQTYVVPAKPVTVHSSPKILQDQIKQRQLQIIFFQNDITDKQQQLADEQAAIDTLSQNNADVNAQVNP